MMHFNIPPLTLDEALVWQKIDNLNKPKGSLGMLETLAFRICRMQHTLSPTLSHPCHLLFAADHGIEREGVSVSPRAVTWQQMINFTHGGGGVNLFCKQHGFELTLVDMGVDHDLSGHPTILNRKIANGTRNFLNEPAMSQQQMLQALNTGSELAENCHTKGCNVLCLGEMGIGNTSPSSVWMSIWGNLPLSSCVGSGSGLNTEGEKHKLAILEQAVSNFKRQPLPHNDPSTIIQYFGGFEMVAAIGAMLRAAELRMIVLVDGFIMSACMLAASKLNPAILDYVIFGHCGDESGHRQLLALMQAQPILQLGMRLGEGTGALCAYPIIESSVRMINEMNNFKDANIDKYF